MKWNEIILTAPELDEDELGNQVEIGRIIIDKVIGRIIPVGKEYKAIDGRTLTETERQFSMPIPYELAKQAMYATIDGIDYTITAVYDCSPRWSIITVKGWRV